MASGEIVFWVFAVLTVALDLTAIGKVLLRGHGVEISLAWVSAIFAFPIFGALVYLLAASPSIRRTTRKKRKRTAHLRRGADASRRVSSRSVGTPASPMAQSMLELAENLTDLPATAGNRVELLAGDELAFQRIEQALESARRSIWAEYYIIRNDVTGKRFLDVLIQKSSEGIEVRLLYDSIGSYWLDARRLRDIRSAGGRADAFLPVNPLRCRWAMHLRNHRKLIVVDGEIGFTGGMNVGDEYSGRARRRGAQHFRDTHLSLQGPAVGDLAQTFAEDWAFATEETLEPPPAPDPIPGQSSRVAIVPSGPDQVYNAHGMIYFAGINSAQTRIYLTSPYFIPDGPTVRALISAALRGVDVRILTPARSDIALVGPASRAFFPLLVGAGVRVFRYQPSMLHGKSIVVDGTWGIVGSANVDFRSFRLNFEVGALVVDPEFAEVLEREFMDDLKASTEVTAEFLEQRSLTDRLRDGATRLLAPIL